MLWVRAEGVGKRLLALCGVAVLLFTPVSAWHAHVGEDLEVSYRPCPSPANTDGRDLHLWILPAQRRSAASSSTTRVRVGACQGGATAAYDLHWQALGEKWTVPFWALVSEAESRLPPLCDPRNGPPRPFCRRSASSHQVETSGLAKVPWCLWGHSGGSGQPGCRRWFPDESSRYWLRSGTAYAVWE
jgi:hypothetical protein